MMGGIRKSGYLRPPPLLVLLLLLLLLLLPLRPRLRPKLGANGLFDPEALKAPLSEHPAAGAAGCDRQIINISETPGEMAPGAKDVPGSGAADDSHE